MRRLDLFYQNINNCITYLTQELDRYYELNSGVIEASEAKATKYADFTTDLGRLQQFIIESYRTRNELIEDYSNLEDFIDSYRTFLGIFNDFSIKIDSTLHFWKIVAERLNRIKEPELDLTFQIDNPDFKIIDLEDKIIEKNFIHFDISDIKKCLMIYSLDEHFENFLASDIHSAHVDLLFVWLNLFDFQNSSTSTQYVVINLDNEIDNKHLISILKLQVLLNGKEVKSIQKYNIPPSKPFSKDFDFNEKYIQFDNISNVLNEYNNQSYLLDKYLKLYHIIENFMYKHKVCVLQKEKDGAPLLIRDFQSLYDRFKSNENSCIQEFFIEVMRLDYDGNTILNLVKNEWDNLETIDSTAPNQIDDLCLSLGLNASYRYATLKTNLNASMFAILVYKIRNSIVHNKDSELHLESTNIPVGAKFLIEKYFIPLLERIVFHLIINRNDIVWYESHELYLYEV